MRMLENFVEQNIPSILEKVQINNIGKNKLLTPYEVALIHHYSDTGYLDLNEQLVNSKGENLTDFGKYLVQTLKKLPNYEGELVFRGTNLNVSQIQRYLNAFEKGIPINELVFLSTSKSYGIATMFLHNVRYEIFSKTGKEIEKFAKLGIYSGQNEREVLFLPNTKFWVRLVEQEADSTLIILREF